MLLSHGQKFPFWVSKLLALTMVFTSMPLIAASWSKTTTCTWKLLLTVKIKNMFSWTLSTLPLFILRALNNVDLHPNLKVNHQLPWEIITTSANHADADAYVQDEKMASKKRIPILMAVCKQFVWIKISWNWIGRGVQVELGSKKVPKSSILTRKIKMNIKSP